MTHYIDKSALVAEIKRRIKEHHSGYLVCLKDILSFIDTLEVKEVDLEKEIDFYINDNYSEGSDGGMISDSHRNIGGVKYNDLAEIARYFFELGLKAQKGE